MVFKSQLLAWRNRLDHTGFKLYFSTAPKLNEAGRLADCGVGFFEPISDSKWFF